MSPAIERLKSEMTALPANERAGLAHFLIQTLDPEAEDGVEAAWDAELERRADEIKTGSVVAKPADQVFAEIRARRLF